MSHDIAKSANTRRSLTILDVLRADVDAAFCNLSRATRSSAGRRCALGATIHYLDAARAGVELVDPYPEARLAVEQILPLRAESTGIEQNAPARPRLSKATHESIREADEFDDFMHGVLAAEPLEWDSAIWNAFQRAACALHLDPVDFSPTLELAAAVLSVRTARARLNHPRLASDLEITNRELAGASSAVGWAHAKAHRVLALATTHPPSGPRRSAKDYWLAPRRR